MLKYKCLNCPKDKVGRDYGAAALSNFYLTVIEITKFEIYRPTLTCLNYRKDLPWCRKASLYITIF